MSTSNPLSNFLSGFIFGSALLLSGVAFPSVIISQLRLSDFYMLKTFLTATAISALLIAIAQFTKLASCRPPKPANLYDFFSYDGNVVGGLLLGCGMALSGACPGTVLVQVSTGVSSSLPVFGGSVLGGLLWSRFGWLTRRKVVTSQEGPGVTRGEQAEDKKEEEHDEDLVIYGPGKLTKNQAVLIYEVLCLVMIVSAAYLQPTEGSSQWRHPILGGLLIGGAQAASLVLRGSTVGVSISFERIGDYISRTFTSLSGSSPSSKPWPSSLPILFLLGILSGSWVLNRILNLPLPEELIQISTARAVLGGVLLVLGARTAGGCTSGHGISGMAKLSIASFISVSMMFAGGIGVATVLS